MFTGLVESLGSLERRERRGPGFRLSIAAQLGALTLGESIAVNGACLTVARITSSGFEVDASAETIEKTTLGRLAVGGRVNLERALPLGGRLGGHLVSGHVDAVVRVRAVERVGEASRVTFEMPDSIARYVAPKGSVALDGVSLTVNAVGASSFEVMLIPVTLGATTLASLRPGLELNVEIDLLARYVAHYLERTHGKPAAETPSAAPSDASDGLSAALKRAGWM
jgi:riboflavin synthase